MAEEAITLRPAVADDRAFLLDVYASTRKAELDQVQWAPGQREAFLEQQFAAQDASYRSTYPDGDFMVIEQGAQAIGRLSVGRLRGEIRLVDIALLPAHQGRGIGTRLIRNLITEAEAKGSRLTLYVEAFNPAHRLYTHLGFQTIGEYGVYELLQWCSPGAAPD